MPPKKKCTKARKAELVFLERPREGPVHCYEAPIHSAENPRRVPTKPVDQNTSAAWVCPQFGTTTSVALKACQKKHRGPHKPQNYDANYSSLHIGGACRRATACKFPPLTFERTEEGAAHPSDHPNHLRKHTQHLHRQPKEGTAAKANIQVNSLVNCREIPLLPAPHPVEPEVCSSPDVETAQVPSISNWRCSSTLPQSSSHAWQPEKELAFGIDSCEGGELESAAVLVTDTPEHEYGVKVTWRQRPLIMKYLQDSGKLSAADVLVKTNLELSRRQTNV
ncbi:RAD9, HUS1, RAD1-interacting nuclear orphan protein 1 [Pezoporus wallicus]|uniref:RAD9, HUS1, RAD1-interacting nuclear orphan protein 1 n=1 Tax=Pezoporus wallicus TaxID=35540 RepID=UPI00254CB902|nr:RAD9, HUS1, RAD1-interacting nuclear orphan protein 1 [Pezoporus wallicus]XP_057285029.1 RAD9, HUS1, RAD1-interacting nuclear orphan protein 1 [Pezoporus wallicus]XP_057285039.1 RAD9, HUS1, RAD1-interacting nuclear orphan protein 1 [Pezoporus wallicus]XP_057285049.1 RAD9, HUS1, RAD1-interacting nuclear orphan protein 1 [Pezoporus wallicus]XP_061328250.1 RAD9, HUS1, RAD1-interacting nuclear orphan protein 1 [Pezoporus flaviventris]XP_061328251.1 RAD9, HUS1, RAD1-interacting nuclear orphan pr